MSENTIADFFNEDPLNLKRENFEAIIEHYRKNRLNFNSAAGKTTSTAATKKLEKAQDLAKSAGIDLGGIEI